MTPSTLVRFALAAGSVLAVAGLALWHPWRRDSLAPFTNLRFVDSVAILPVENRTGNAELSHLSAGITDEIAARLKQVGLIKVSDPYSVGTLVGLELTARQLADSLGVQKLVLGALYRTVDGVRLNVRVSDGRSGDVLYSERYEWNSEYGFEAALNLAGAFVDDYLARTFVEVPAPPRPTVQSPGREKYLVGRAWLGRRTPQGMARARAAFSEALAIDSTFADAYSGLSNVYALSLAYRYRIADDGYAAAGFALALANRAIALDPQSAGGYTARGYLASRSFAPVSEVASDCRKAIQLEPSAADVLSWCARVLNQRGQTDAAFTAAEQAIALDPQNAGRRLALAYDALAIGRYDRAVDEAQLAADLEPDLVLPRAIEARGHLLAGRPERCAAMDLGPHAGIRATCLHQLGGQAEARAIVDSLVSALEHGGIRDPVFTEVIRAEDLATYYAWVGDPAQALEWVAHAYELSPSGVEPRVLESALFDRVRQDPEFAGAVDSIRAEIWERVREAAAPADR